MRKILICAIVCCCALRASAQDFALKTNTLYWLTTSINGEAEVGVAPRWTLDLGVAYNPWNFSGDRKMHFLLLQPEARYWLCERFEGHFVGVHLHGAQYFGGFSDSRYDGYLAGGGFTYGHDWLLSPHWNLEMAVGVGYARLWYKETPCMKCIKNEKDGTFNYFGLTRAAISFTYIF